MLLLDQQAAIRLHYDTFAKEYDGVEQGVEHILSRLKIPPGSSILDIGCGTGSFTFRLQEISPFRRIIGVDISDGVLDIARNRARDLHLENIEFVRASATDLAFGDEDFDCVVSNMTLHLIGDQHKALAEIVRVLKPSGSAVLQFQGGDDVAPEMMEMFQRAWDEVLPGKRAPRLFKRTTCDMVAQDLLELGIERFDIHWRRSIMRINEPDVPDFLSFFGLVAGFWRWRTSKEAAARIEELMAKQVKDKAASTGYFTSTVNILLIEFTKTRQAKNAGGKKH